MKALRQETFDNLVACRDLLAFTLTDQQQPPDDLFAPFEHIVSLLFRRIEELRLEHGFNDPDITIYDPRFGSKPD